MIPYILAAVGGYLIGQSRKDEQYAKGGMAKVQPEWSVTITSKDGDSYDWVGFAKNEDDALSKAEKEAGFESVESGINMITDSDGKKIEYADGGMMAKGQTDEELYNALVDMGYDYGEFGSDNFDDSGFSEMAINLGYRWDDSKKLWFSRGITNFKNGGKTKGTRSEVEKALDKLKKYGADIEKRSEKGRKKWYVYNDGQWGLLEDLEGFYVSDDDLIDLADKYASE